MRRLLGLLISAVVLGGAGCGSTRLIGAGPYNDANAKSARQSAIRYYLAKDILLVEAEVKQTRVTTLRAENDGAGHFTFETRSRVKFDSSVASISSKTVADTSVFFQVDIENGPTAEDSVTVDVTDQGLLRSVNATSASQSGAIVKNIAQVAASVATVAGVLAGRDPGLVRQVQGLFEKDAQGLPKLKESLAALPLEVLYLLHEQADARALWARKLRIEALITEREDDLSAVEGRIQKVTGADINILKGKIDLLGASVRRLRDERQGIIDLLESSLQAFRTDKHLLAEPLTRKLSVAFDLEEVPAPSLLDAGMDPVMVKGKLLEGNFTRMAQLFEDAGVVFTLTPPKLFAGDPSAVPKAGAAATTEPAGEPAGKIFFRQSYPLVLRLFAKASLPSQPQLNPAPAAPLPVKTDIEAKNKAPPPRPAPASNLDAVDKEQIRLVEDRVMDLIPATAPQLFVSFAPKDFATMRLSLAFDEKGRLARLERSGTSQLAGETGALADGLGKARDEYQTTLQKLVDIQDSRRLLSVESLQGQIDKVQKQRELLDARVSLEGDLGTKDLTLQKQRLDAELAALQARASLEVQRGAIAEQARVDDLKARLDQLAAEINNIKIRLNNGQAGPQP